MSVFMESGRFSLGANYWASHAGTNMWSDWRADVVDSDFERLAKAGVKTLRVFPLWPVFQPIVALCRYGGILVEYSFDETSLPNTPEGQAGMSVQALAHFKEFCELADKHGIKLVVGLITGWMSGRLHVPPALEGLNVLTDPKAIMWEVRFVRCFVETFKNETAIVAWDLGNECNCMGFVANADEAYAWTSQIVGAILAKDHSRPIVSGMHSLLPDSSWTPQQQGELTDILTTHPYPYFTPHTDWDPINSIRSELHATAETLFYRGLGGKPCFVEELGTLGPMYASEEVAADFVRTNLFTLWAHDCRGFMWWCANEQSHLTHPPYNWCSIERELGLFRQDGSKKPVLETISGFDNFLDEISKELPSLPSRIVDGVCILTKGQDTWAAAYMNFILAKQAGLDMEFTYAGQAIPEAKLYMMPSLVGDMSFSSDYFCKVMEKVEQGATLYVSVDGALLSPFNEVFGAKVLHRRKTNATVNVNLDGNPYPIQTAIQYKLTAADAEVLAVDDNNDPVFTMHQYGKGKVFFMSLPLERSLLNASDAFKSGHYRFYETVAKHTTTAKIAKIKNSNIGMTEHIISDKKRLLVLVNYDPVNATAELELPGEWSIGKFMYGELGVKANNASVIEIVKG